MNGIVGSPIDSDKGPDGVIFVAVAWSLSAPWTAIYPSFAVNNTDDRIVVIQEVRSGYILEPEAAMGTFTSTALSEEQKSLPIFDSHGSVHLKRRHACSSESVQEHERVIHAVFLGFLYLQICFAEVR